MTVPPAVLVSPLKAAMSRTVPSGGTEFVFNLIDIATEDVLDNT